MKRIYPLGDQIVTTATFVDPKTNINANPSQVVLRVRDPNNVETRPTILNIGVGIFTAAVQPNLAGIWRTRWEGTGVIIAAIEHQFEVAPSGFA